MVIVFVLIVLWVLRSKKTLTLVDAARISALTCYPATFIFALLRAFRVASEQGQNPYTADGILTAFYTALLWGSIWFLLCLVIARIVYRKRFVVDRDEDGKEQDEVEEVESNA